MLIPLEGGAIGQLRQEQIWSHYFPPAGRIHRTEYIRDGAKAVGNTAANRFLWKKGEPEKQRPGGHSDRFPGCAKFTSQG